MLAKKKWNYCGAMVFLTLAVIFIAGCTPPGPRALLKGRKYLESGDYAAAVDQFKTATTLLATNAQAWNYLGVACQRAGQPDDAAKAYQHALLLDRDLSEAHFNLGCLWLEQNRPADAKTELTAYTLRRAGEPDGWLKLGAANLRTGDLAGAEKSYSQAYYLNTNSAESLNGLGMVFARRGRARDAAQYFASAIHRQPDYADATLNLATVAQQDLHDNKLALENYRTYLTLVPQHEKNWDAVNAIVASLETPGTVAAAAPAPPPVKPAPTNLVAATTAPPVTAGETRTQAVVRASIAPPVVSETKTQTAVRPLTPPRTATPAPRNLQTPPPRQTPPAAEVVTVNPEPVIVTEVPPGSAAKPVVSTQLNSVRWVAPATSPTKYVEKGVTPLPSPGSPPPVWPEIIQPATTQPAKPVHIVPPAPPSFPRYLYRSPRKPAPGNRVAASAAFTQAHESEQGAHWPEAMESYRRATESDPGWFEAQYNYGVLAYRLQNFSAALSADEMALAIQPDSVDARYNFALALKAAGYATDAANELNKVIAASPGEARAQLALGNLYAREMNDPAQARAHYLKVLELDPRNSQANDIRLWLTTNPQ